MEVLNALQDSGADIIEIGIPYSDPLADGPVIQQSSAKALENGMTIPLLFEQLQSLRSTIHLPIVLMGYLNPVIRYGLEDFCKKAADCGVDGLIIPDLPLYAFQKTYKPVFSKYGLDFIFLVTPETSEERIRKMDELSRGFIYVVSSSSITGGEGGISGVEAYLQRLKNYKLKNPLMVGFGISKKEDVDLVCQYADGAIIGSAYLRALGKDSDIQKATEDFMEGLTKQNR